MIEVLVTLTCWIVMSSDGTISCFCQQTEPIVVSQPVRDQTVAASEPTDTARIGVARPIGPRQF